MRKLLFIGLVVAERLAAENTFSRDVLPVLEKRCWGCHGPAVQMAGLRLDTAEGITKGSHRGTILEPGNSSKSMLIRLIERQEPKRAMPPTGKPLSAAEISAFRLWVDSGAVWPEMVGAPKTESVVEANVPLLPAVALRSWPRNSLDYPLLAKLESEGKLPRAEASRRSLLRRVAFDLTGLPPTIPDARAYLLDNRFDAYDRLIQRMMRSAKENSIKEEEILSAGYRQEREPEALTMGQWRDAAFYVAGLLESDTPKGSITSGPFGPSQQLSAAALQPASWLSTVAKGLAARAAREMEGRDSMVQLAHLFELALSRPPSGMEQAAFRQNGTIDLMRAARYVIEHEEFKTKP
jgi:hypothetical protein